MLTSLEPLSDDESGTPDELRALVRARKAAGADLIKIFASKSIREGGGQTMSDAQLVARCGEAQAQGLRTLVHAHSAESMRAAALAGCTQIEHGVFATAEVLALMAARGHLLRSRSAAWSSATTSTTGRSTRASATTTTKDSRRWRRRCPWPGPRFRLALATPGLKVVFGTDAVAGAHGRNAEDLVCRVKDGGQKPMDADRLRDVARRRVAGPRATGSARIAPGLEADLIAVAGDPVAGHHGAAARALRHEGPARSPP